jgi:hypothetical protein
LMWRFGVFSGTAFSMGSPVHPIRFKLTFTIEAILSPPCSAMISSEYQPATRVWRFGHIRVACSVVPEEFIRRSIRDEARITVRFAHLMRLACWPPSTPHQNSHCPNA